MNTALKYSPNRFKSILIALPVVALMMLSSCQEFFLKEVDNIELPGTESRLVAYAYISPHDTVLRVHLSRSVPYINTGLDLTPIRDRATVRMGKNGQNLTQLTYHEPCNCYIIHAENMVIEAGYDYKLEVQFNDILVEATCQVPEMQITAQHVSIDPLELVLDQWGNSETKLSWQITPPVLNAESYYTTGAYVKQYGLFETGSGYDTVYLYTGSLYLDRGTRHFSDSDGRSYRFRSSHWGYRPWQFDPYNPDPDIPKDFIDSLFVYVLQTDYHYYRFHKSANDHDYADDNPFAETVHVYSNIEGGLGAFGGYTRKDFPVGLIANE